MTRVHHLPSRPVIIYTPDTRQQPAEVFQWKDASVHLELSEMVRIRYLFVTFNFSLFTNKLRPQLLAYNHSFLLQDFPIPNVTEMEYFGQKKIGLMCKNN